MPTRRRLLSAALAAALLPALAAEAHHGWRWTDGGEFELTGVITEANLGNPHGELTIDVDGETWTAEIGQPWRNQQAGLTDDMLTAGTEITLRGERSADPEDRLMKAEVVVLNGTEHVLYPDRV